MKIFISYPPIFNASGSRAMIPQNRNVQYFEKPNYLLSITYAQAATWLKNLGFDTFWDDGSAQNLDEKTWYDRLLKNKPDVIVFESTTPVMKFYWSLVDKIKKSLPNIIVIFSGYHSMRRPEETFSNSNADIVLLGSNVDFILKDLIPYIDSHTNWRLTCDTPNVMIRMSEKDFRKTGTYRQIEKLDDSPDIDRDLVSWKNYAYENGNFLLTPGTYATSAIRDCTFGKCTFCRYNGPDLTYSQRSVIRGVNEYDNLINTFGVKEIFDDSGVWYRGNDAQKFAQELIDRNLHKKAYFGINTRFGYLDEETIKSLSKANFRFVLVGMEAGDNYTLSKLRKGYSIEAIYQNLELMTKYGLHPHITLMVGYYWQTEEMLKETVKTVKDIMRKGLARTLQTTICIPLDYTPYHQECIENDLLLTDDYNDFDMSKVIVKTPIAHIKYYEAISDILGIVYDPVFLIRQLRFASSFKKKEIQFLTKYSVRALRRVRNVRKSLTQELK